MQRAIIGGASLVLGVVGCSADVTTFDVVGESATPAEMTTDSAGVLRLGDDGSDVRKATAFFTMSGYFENEALRREYPAWRPVVGAGPLDDEIFGAELENAVKEFQARGGLTISGEIDGVTRALMAKPRCGVPDSRERFGASDEEGVEKWATKDPVVWQPDLAVTYSVAGIPAGKFPAGTLSLLENAFAKWGRKAGEAVTVNTPTGLTFQRVNAIDSEIDVFFCSSNVGSDCMSFDFTKHFADASISAHRIRFNSSGAVNGNAFTWTNDGTGIDVTSVALHEMGHILGLEHSSVTNGVSQPVMFPGVDTGERVQALTSDDYQPMAVSPYTVWRPVAGVANEARDVGASNTLDAARTETVWKIGNTTVAGEGFSVHRWQESSSTWTSAIAGTGGIRIDVQQNVPWVVLSSGLIRSRTGVSTATPNGTGWNNRGNCPFKDVGAASNNVVWAIGGSANAKGDFDVYRWNGADNVTNCSGWLRVEDDAEAIVGDGIRIDVSPIDGSPWVVATDGSIYHRNGVSGATPTGSSWSKYGGHAADITIGPDAFGVYGALWITGYPSETTDVFLLNIQSTLPSGTPPPPERNHWYRVADGSGTSISAGRNGMPWLIGNSNSMWRRRP